VKGSVLILGANSAIARGTANGFARRGFGLCLAGRDAEELQRMCADLHIRHRVPVSWLQFDAEDLDSHSRFYERVLETAGELAGAVVAFGYLGESLASRSFPEAGKVIAVNFTGAASILEQCAAHFERRRSGFIVGLSSVAGDRGRQSNYVYGAAKAGLSVFLQGLRNRLHRSNVRVITIKPGFVDTAMTFGKPGLFLVASPWEIGEKIVRALEGSRDVVYLPWFWRYIMLIIRLIPEPLFKRLSL
jgi:short-subunit dehydrogenase